MSPPSYMRSVVDRNVVMRRIPVMWNMPMEQNVFGGWRGRDVHCVYEKPKIHEKWINSVTYTTYISRIRGTCFGYHIVAVIRLYRIINWKLFSLKGRDFGLTKNYIYRNKCLSVCRKTSCKLKYRHVKEYFSVLVRYFFCKAEISLILCQNNSFLWFRTARWCLRWAIQNI